MQLEALTPSIWVTSNFSFLKPLSFSHFSFFFNFKKESKRNETDDSSKSPNFFVFLVSVLAQFDNDQNRNLTNSERAAILNSIDGFDNFKTTTIDPVLHRT